MIAHGLAIIRNKFFNGTLNPERIAVLALYHDVGEVITGDLATPIKHFNPKIKKAYDEIEEVARQKLLEMLPKELQGAYHPFFFFQDEDREHWQLVKAADKICAYLKCLEELKAGNQEFSKAEKTIKADLAKFNLPEVSYFMKTYIPSFLLPLDELN